MKILDLSSSSAAKYVATMSWLGSNVAILWGIDDKLHSLHKVRTFSHINDNGVNSIPLLYS